MKSRDLHASNVVFTVTRRSIFTSFLTLFFPAPRTEVTIGCTGNEFYAYWTDSSGQWHTSGPVSLSQALSIARNVLLSDRA